MIKALRSLWLPVAAVAFTAGTALAQDTIKVGEFASLTGKEAAFGQASHKGTLLAIEELNATGGALGKKFELLTEDNQSKQGESATIAQKLISRDKVVALLGEVASGRSLEAAPVAQNAKIPMVTPASTNPRVTEMGSYIFRVCFIDPLQGRLLAKFAKDTLHAKRIAVLSSLQSPYSVGLAKYFKEPFTAGAGEIVAEQKFSEGDKDFRAQLTTIKGANPDAIFVPGYYTEAALICKQARDLGLTVPIFGGDGWEAPQLIEIGGAAVEGTYYMTHFTQESTAANVQKFVKDFRAKFADESPDGMAALGYDSAMVLGDAIKRAGSIEPSKIREALAATKNFSGVTGNISIDSKRNATKSAVVLTVKDGHFKYVESISP